MSYIHCKNCRWQQDDFLSKNIATDVNAYNPFTWEANEVLKKMIGEGKDLDDISHFIDMRAPDWDCIRTAKDVEKATGRNWYSKVDQYHIERTFKVITYRDALISVLHKSIDKAYKMKWATRDKWRYIDGVCPKCGSKCVED